MLYREIIAVSSEIHINTLCAQNVEFVNVKPGGTYSNRWVLGSCDRKNANCRTLTNSKYVTQTYFPFSQHTQTHLAAHTPPPNSTTYGHQISDARRSPDSAVCHVLSHNTQLMSSASRLTRYKNVRFLKMFHCFIPARWTNQRVAGGASSSTGQVTKKVADGKGRVGTPRGHHPVSKRDAQKFYFGHSGGL